MAKKTNNSYVTQISTETIYNSSINKSRSTQLGSETVYSSSINQSRSTQIFIETAYSIIPVSKVTQLSIEIAYTNPTAPSIPANNALISQLASETIRNSSTTQSNTSQLAIETIRNSVNQSNTSQLAIETIRNSVNQSNISQLVIETAYQIIPISKVTQLVVETAYPTPSTPSAPANNALSSQLGFETVYNTQSILSTSSIPLHIFTIILGQGIG